MKTIYILLLPVLFISCSSSTLADKTATENISAILFSYDKQELTITVVSNGCTMKEDFIIQQNNNLVTVVRTKKDDCKAMPQSISISWSFKEAGIDPNLTYSIQNRFIANPNIANIPTHEE